jgi:hypothetical protein
MLASTHRSGGEYHRSDRFFFQWWNYLVFDAQTRDHWNLIYQLTEFSSKFEGGLNMSEGSTSMAHFKVLHCAVLCCAVLFCVLLAFVFGLFFFSSFFVAFDLMVFANPKNSEWAQILWRAKCVGF